MQWPNRKYIDGKIQDRGGKCYLVYERKIYSPETQDRGEKMSSTVRTGNILT
jgi:hypothetical protein